MTDLDPKATPIPAPSADPDVITGADGGDRQRQRRG